MCVRISIVSSLDELCDNFNVFDSQLDFNPIYNGTPLHNYLIYDGTELLNLTWGLKTDKLIIHSKLDDNFNNLEKGVLAITGFFLWKTIKAPAPIGFGDHKETTKIIPHYIKRKDDGLFYLPVLINKKEDYFTIVVQKSKQIISPFQTNEPFLLKNFDNWIENGSLDNYDFDNQNFIIHEISNKVNDVNCNSVEIVEPIL